MKLSNLNILILLIDGISTLNPSRKGAKTGLENGEKSKNDPRTPVGRAESGDAPKTSFRTHIEKGEYYVDKSRFIVKFFQHPARVISISRPRRCGKTMNLGMVLDFFSIDFDGSKLFHKDLYIMSNETREFRNKYMNKIPVIFLSLIDMDIATSYEEAKRHFAVTVQLLYKKFKHLLKSDRLSDLDKQIFNQFALNTSPSSATFGLQTLCSLLYQHYRLEPIIIIDEGDSPVAAAVQGNFTNLMEAWLSNFFLTSLKGHEIYSKVIVTAVTPMNSYLPNNVNRLNSVFSIFDSDFAEDFGFTENEVMELLKRDGKEYLMPEIEKWYDRFTIGGKKIFNPESIMECRKSGWLVDRKASGSASLQSLAIGLLQNQGLLPPMHFQVLFAGMTFEKEIPCSFNFRDILSSEGTMWLFCAHSGLVSLDKNPVVKHQAIRIRVAGHDIREMLKRDIINPLIETGNKILPNYTHFATAVETGDKKKVQTILKKYIDGAGTYLTKIGFDEDEFQNKLKEYITTIVQKWLKSEKDIKVKDKKVEIIFFGNKTASSVPWAVTIRRNTNSTGFFSALFSNEQLITISQKCMVTIVKGGLKFLLHKFFPH